MGFIEETGAAQYLRDVRVTAIYEGTNGIQAMDLVARKMMDGGDAAFALLDEIEAAAEAAKDALPDLVEPVCRPAKPCARRLNGWSRKTWQTGLRALYRICAHSPVFWARITT